MNNNENCVVFITNIKSEFAQVLLSKLSARGWQIFVGISGSTIEYSDREKYFDNNLFLVEFDSNSQISIKKAVDLIYQRAKKIDLYIDTSSLEWNKNNETLRDIVNTSKILQEFKLRAIAPLRTIIGFLDLIRMSEKKRICFITSTVASINQSTNKTDFGFCMSLAALHKSLYIMRNALKNQNFSFRLLGYDNQKKGTSLEQSVENCIGYFCRDRGVAEGINDEENFILRDQFGSVVPW